jgi:hypothetical protein
MGFREIVAPLVERGIPVIPLRPRTKIASISDWQNLASTDLQQIEAWAKDQPDANAACVAQARVGSYWFFEIDHSDVQTRIRKETGKSIPRTFAVRSSAGRGHYYFKQNEASIALGNIAQPFVKHSDWSARIDREYVVSPKSLHPRTGLPYELLSDAEIIEAPQWLIDWLASQKVLKPIPANGHAEGPIIEGGRNNTLASIAGSWRSKGLPHEQIEAGLLHINRERCQPELPEEEVRVIAASIARYPVGETIPVLVNGVPAGTKRLWTPGNTAAAVLDEPEELLAVQQIPYPVFPKWIMSGTSIYEGLVKPVCDVNCRYEEYMFMPAIAMMLNYLAMKVKFEHNTDMIPSLFIVLIGQKGRIIKSSSVEDAITYFQFAGISGHATRQMSNAEGKSLVFQAGSPEGLGLEMNRLNCRNAVLFYDELSTLTKKAGIESSTLTSNLLTMYESGIFQNAIKGRKESYSFSPGTYCISLIACSTNKGFLPHWSQLSSKSSGLEDRFFFLMQPQSFKPVTVRRSVNFADGALNTRKMIERAIEKSVFKADDFILTQELNKGTITNREAGRLEKFALYFAVDRGLDEVNGDCFERALHLVKYEQAVKKYLQTYEGSTREATLQMEIESTLRKKGNRMNVRKLFQAVHAERWGSTIWSQAYSGLIRIGKIKESGAGNKSDPKMVQLLWITPEDEDD